MQWEVSANARALNPLDTNSKKREKKIPRTLHCHRPQPKLMMPPKVCIQRKKGKTNQIQRIQRNAVEQLTDKAA